MRINVEPNSNQLYPQFQQTEETMRAIKRILQLLFTTLAFFALTSHATTFTIDLLSEPAGSAIGTPAHVVFSGSTKQIAFQDASDGYDFLIAGSSASSLIGLKGNIGGTFTIGGITTFGTLQTAPVTGTGTFSIFDGTNTLTADLALHDVATFGTALGLNVDAVANLSNFSYAGGNSDLLSFMNSVSPTVTVSAQFLPARNLTALTKALAVNSAVYSGTVAATVPEPSSYLLLATGLLAAAISVRRRRIG